MQSERLFVQRLSAERVEETTPLRDGQTTTRIGSVPAVYLQPKRRTAYRIGRLFERALKGLTLVVWLSPLLIVPKFIANFIDHSLSDAILVAWVVIVVLFFVALCGYLTMKLITGPHALMARVAAPPSEGSELPRGQTLAPSSDVPDLVGRRITARGQLHALVADKAELISDLWLPDATGYVRCVEALRVHVQTDTVPVLVELESAPVVIAPARPETAARELVAWPRALVRDLPQGEAGSLMQLRAGDEVEVTGLVHAVADDVNALFEGSVGQHGSAYRQRGAHRELGLVLRGTLDEPVSLRRL